MPGDPTTGPRGRFPRAGARQRCRLPSDGGIARGLAGRWRRIPRRVVLGSPARLRPPVAGPGRASVSPRPARCRGVRGRRPRLPPGAPGAGGAGGRGHGGLERADAGGPRPRPPGRVHAPLPLGRPVQRAGLRRAPGEALRGPLHAARAGPGRVERPAVPQPPLAARRPASTARCSSCSGRPPPGSRPASRRRSRWRSCWRWAAAAGTLALLRRYCSTPGGPGPAAFAAVALSPVLWVEGAGPGPRRRPGGPPLRRLAPGRSPTRSRARLRPPRGRRRLEADRGAARRDVPRLSRGSARPVAGAPRARRRGHERSRPRRRARVLALLERPRHAARAARVPGRAQAHQHARGGRSSSRRSRCWARRTPPPRSPSLGTLLTAGLALLGAVLAFRAPGVPALAGAMAGVSLLATTLAAPVFHPWYLIPSLVLSVELRDPAWRDWLLRFGTLSLLADGSVLLAYGSTARAVYTRPRRRGGRGGQPARHPAAPAPPARPSGPGAPRLTSGKLLRS